jgi:hypothetical protein
MHYFLSLRQAAHLAMYMRFRPGCLDVMVSGWRATSAVRLTRAKWLVLHGWSFARRCLNWAARSIISSIVTAKRFAYVAKFALLF